MVRGQLAVRPKLSYFVLDDESAIPIRVRTRQPVILGETFPWSTLRVVAIGWEDDRMVVHLAP